MVTDGDRAGFSPEDGKTGTGRGRPAQVWTRRLHSLRAVLVSSDAEHSVQRSQWCVVRARQVIGFALVITGLAGAGCYSYVPVSLQAAESTEDVRLRVTDDAAARLVKDLGTFSPEIEGRLAGQGRDSVSLGVAIDRTYRGTTVGTTTQTLFLARSEILEMRRREFSRRRTILASAGVVGGFAILAVGIKQLVDPNGPPDDQPGQPPPAPVRRLPGHHIGVRISIP